VIQQNPEIGFTLRCWVADRGGRTRICWLEAEPSGIERVRKTYALPSPQSRLYLACIGRSRQVQPWVDTVFELFGAERVMFGVIVRFRGWRGISRVRMRGIRR